MHEQKKRFGQDACVDRGRPHIFHRDYWALRAVQESVAGFFRDSGAELRGKRVLDYGAGDSPYAPLAANAGAELLTADLGEPAPGAVRICSDGRVELPDNSIDAIISTQVLEHVADVQLYLREGARILRPGGSIFCSTHGDWVLHRVPTDFRRWTVDGLRYEFELAGFRVEKAVPAIGILATSTHLRAAVFGGMLRRVPFLRWLRPILFLLFNLRMGLEEMITPASAMESHPQLIFVTARKPPT
jgi:SAM-dependent methyltransferase